MVSDFRSNSVSEREKLKYLVANGILFTLVSDPLVSSGLKYTIMDALNLALMLAAVVVGTYYCYLQNRKGDDSDFATRFVCLGIPVALRVLAVAIPLGILVGIIEAASGVGAGIDEGGEETYTTTATQVVFTAVLSVAYYAYLARQIRAVSARQGVAAGPASVA